MTSEGWTTRLKTLAQAKQVRQFLAEVEARGGWEGRRTSGSHIRLRHRDGGFVTVSGTPRSPAACLYLRQHIRQAEKGTS